MIEKKPKLGTGKRFKKLSGSIEGEYEKKGKSPAEAKRIAGATAAKIGREALGSKRMTQLAVAGKKREAKQYRSKA